MRACMDTYKTYRIHWALTFLHIYIYNIGYLLIARPIQLSIIKAPDPTIFSSFHSLHFGYTVMPTPEMGEMKKMIVFACTRGRME